MMHPLAMLEALKAKYRTYVDSFQFYRNPAIRDWVEGKRAEGRLLYREPFVTLAKPFAPGGELSDLVGEPGGLHPDVMTVFTKKVGDPTAGAIEPFAHQIQAISQVLGGHNITVTSGTGSGKSFTFYIPVVSAALQSRDKGGNDGFRAPVAVIIYPMNALANSQYEDIAARLAGTGLTVCNYTGDLKRTREAADKNFQDLTGREVPYDSEIIDRGTLQSQGCDILLTNFKMLEYALVRRRDSHLFSVLGAGGRLQFLVLDEMHTYSGRQGADMALLVRRFKERTGTMGTLRCIGTSATVDSGDPVEAARVISDFASRLFGESFDPTHVVTETYGAHETHDPSGAGMYLPAAAIPASAVEAARAADTDEAVVAALAPHLLPGDASPEAVRDCLPVAWLERALWAGVQSMTTLTAAYQEQVRPEATTEEAACEIEAAAMLGSAVKVPGPRATPVGMLTPKVHAFFSQGLPVTRCLRSSDDDPHLSELGESTCRRCTDAGYNGVESYPVVFCAACGVDAYVAARQGDAVQARNFLGDVDGTQPVYLMLDEWDEDDVPVDPADVKQNGEPAKGRDGAVPRRVVVCGLCGDLTGVCGHTDALREAVLIAAPMLLCPGCGVRYDGANSEYNKFFQVGAVGRATATDVLIDGVLHNLGDDQKPQVMAFTDNQQDSSFQAAHLRSMSRRFHLRRALYAALDGTGPGSMLDTAEVADQAFQAMKDTGTLPPFQQEATASIVLDPSGDNAKAAGRYRRYLKAGVIVETSGAPRKAQPNMEDTGLVVVDYQGLDPDFVLPVLRDPANGEHVPALLRTLADDDPDLAMDLLRVLLDVMRRNRALKSTNEDGPAAPFQDHTRFENDVLQQINPDAYFHASLDMPRGRTVYDEKADGHRRITVRRLAGKQNSDGSDAPQTTTLTRWLRRELNCDTPEARTLIRGAVKFLQATTHLVPSSPGLAVNEEKLRYWRADEPVGYRCPRCASRWIMTTARQCPRCVKSKLKIDRPGRDDFFREEYTRPLDEALRLEAAEHTGSLSGDQRKAIEKSFRTQTDPLNVLVCTPTMELGVDIGTLSAVYMRNVPPSPANYAQRQGRAGRQAQPSAVVTFCSAQGRNGPHDQYFFKRPERIIAGRIAAPRFLLDNRALLTAHLHALILGAREDDLPDNLTVWVDLDAPNGGLTPDFRHALEQFIADNRNSLIARGHAAFRDVFDTATAVDESLVAETVDGFVGQLHTDMAALVSYYQELSAERDLLNARADAKALERAEERRRHAVEKFREDIRDGRGDFYPLAWLSTRGFLPTYAFPRKAVLLRFNNQRFPRVRSRSIALREFAPGNSVYHLGKRYQITKASLGPDTATVTQEFLLCSCGAYLNGTEAAARSQCPSCDAQLSTATRFSAAIPLSDSYAVQSENVGADSEERLRMGYRVHAAYRLPKTGVTRTTVTDTSGSSVDTTYVHLGHLLRINAGLARSDDAFSLCGHCRSWNPPEDHWDVGKDCHPTTDNRIDDVSLYADGRHDMLFLDVIAPTDVDADDYAYTYTYALLTAISSVFGIELSEIEAEVFPHPDGDRQPQGRRILLYEMDEGGIGVLDRVTDQDTWAKISRQALDLLHANPDGTNQPNACTDSCYECLRTFHNQWQHDNLDRTLILDALVRAAAGVTVAAVATGDSWDEAVAHYASEEEQVMVQALIAADLPAPDRAHDPLPKDAPITEADLVYVTEGPTVLVFLDGSVHDDPIVDKIDKIKRAKLRDLGYTIVTIRYDDMPGGITTLKRRLGL